MKKLLLILAMIPMMSSFVSFGDDYEYDDEYWKSVQREKTMRESGLDDLADHEAAMRRDRLRYQRKPESQEITSGNSVAMTVGVVILIGFVCVIVHLSTKNTDEEADNVPSTSIDNKTETTKNGDVISQLERLANLKDRGAITKDEFEREKQKLFK